MSDSLPHSIQSGPANISTRPAEMRDVSRICEIYNQSILTVATYDIDPEPIDKRYQWLLTMENSNMPVLVAINRNEHVVGWASLSLFNTRPGFIHTLENAIYVCSSSKGIGVGRLLLKKLIEIAGERDTHSIIAKIDSTNTPSIQLHSSLGFVHAGLLKEAGFKFNKWLDVIMMQYMF